MTIQYQGVWSLQSAAQLQSTQRWVTDPLFDYTTLLLQADDAANGAQNNTFLDSSSNAFAITRNGGNPGMTQGSFTPFSSQPGAWSNFASAASASVGFSNATAALVGSTASTFTAECWIYMTDAPVSGDGVPALIGMDATFNSSIYLGFGPNASQKLVLRWFDGASKTATGNTTLALNTWYHIAVVANSNALAMYVNGVPEVLTGTTTLTNRNATTNTFSLFLNSSSSNYQFRGYASNIRVCTSAVYTSAFTPSTSPLTTTSQGATNCRLLTSQSNLFIDNSSNAYTLTLQGSPSVQPFSPFAPQFQWTPSVIGGSGYFDGTGDYLSAASNTALTFGTGDFTVEGWFYANALGGQPTILNNGSDAAGLVITLFSSKIYAYFVGAGNVFGSSGATIVTNTWYHFAWVRSGSTNTFYLNGAVYGATYSSAGNHASTGGVGIGYSVAGTAFAAWNGYIANVRMVKGTAVYTGAFTPPIAPVTTSGPASSYSSTTNVNTTFTSTNTSLLTNFTNAGIYDGTMKNNLETVGNAQVSTAVVKYGSGSMYFDGTTNTYLAQNPATTDLYAFGSGDFTIECWLYLISTSSIRTVYDSRASGTASSATPTIYIDAGTIKYYVSGADRITGIALTTNQWYHVVVCRSGTSTRMFINGTQVGSTYSDSTVYINSARRPFIAGDSNSAGANLLNGYIDDLRITKGIARYTANFIPPSVALPRQ